MPLQQIDSGCSLPNDALEKRLFTVSAKGIASLYWAFLPDGFDAGACKKVKIVFHEALREYDGIPQDDPALSPVENLKAKKEQGLLFYHNFLDNLGEIVLLHRRFDFHAWFSADKPAKKEMLCLALHQALLEIAGQSGWDKARLQHAFEACREVNFDNQWEVARLKTKSRPGGKLKASVWAEYDLADFHIFALFRDASGGISQKTLLKTFNGLEKGVYIPEMPYEALGGKTKWEGGAFVLYGKDGAEVGRAAAG